MATKVIASGLSGLFAGKSFPLGPEQLTIGRSPESSIPLTADPGVSRNHAQIYLQGDLPFITDLGSSNGTYVNGERLSEPKQLTDGDIVAIGPHSFIIRIQHDQPHRKSPQNGDPPTCLICGGHQVLSVQSVASSGISSTVSTSASLGGGHILKGGPNLVGGTIGTSRSVTKTDLAKLLSMPFRAPKHTKYIDKAANSIGCASWVVSSLLLTIVFHNDQITWLAVLIGLFIYVAVVAIFEAANKPANEIAEIEHNRKQSEIQRVYSQRKEVYDRLYYCPQCHTVFDPATGRSAKPEQLASIL